MLTRSRGSQIEGSHGTFREHCLYCDGFKPRLARGDIRRIKRLVCMLIKVRGTMVQATPPGCVLRSTASFPKNDLLPGSQRVVFELWRKFHRYLSHPHRDIRSPTVPLHKDYAVLTLHLTCGGDFILGGGRTWTRMYSNELNFQRLPVGAEDADSIWMRRTSSSWPSASKLGEMVLSCRLLCLHILLPRL